MEDQPSVLILGAGADNFQHEGELTSSLIKVAIAIKKRGYQVVLVDNNPFNVAPKLTCVVDDYEMGTPTPHLVTTLIEKYRPTALLPVLGGRDALQLTEKLATSGVLNKYGVAVWGMPVATVRQINNLSLLNQTLRQINANTKKIAPVTTYAEAKAMVDEIGFPVVVRAVIPQAGSVRQIVHDYGELQIAVSDAIQHSSANQALVQQSLAGLKEIEVIVARDKSGTMMQLAMIEDIDPIGIHAGDSMAVLPAQTLLERQIQDMRDVAFRITRKLRVIGINHVQFALDEDNDRFYVIKNSPYFDRMTTFVEQATGYPVARVCGHLYTGALLRDLRLDHGLAKHSAITEPVLDRTAIRVPVFANDELGIPNHNLNTEKQSVGSVIGLGRSLVEALLKAVSELHTNFYALEDLGDEILDQFLIHPSTNRLLPVLEAIRRGYLISELVELTKLDPYYLVQFKYLVSIEQKLISHSKDQAWLKKAKYWGFSDHLIGQLWQVNDSQVWQLRQDAQIHRTFKPVDPSAGELDQRLSTFYSTFELENESEPLTNHRALVIGAGPRRLGNGVANDYLLTRATAELKRQGYQIIVIEDNPNSTLLLRELANKIYLEPRDLEHIKAVVALEKPEVILSFADQVSLQSLPAVQGGAIQLISIGSAKISEPSQRGIDYQFNAFFDGQYTYPLGLTRLTLTDEGIKSEFAPDLPADFGPAMINAGEVAIAKCGHPGIYQLPLQIVDGQLVEGKVTIPSSWELAFLGVTTGLDLAAVLIRLQLNKFNGRLLRAASQRTIDQPTCLEAVMPYSFLHLRRPARLDQMLGARLEWKKT